MTGTPFRKLAELCRNLEATSKRKEKTRLLSEFLRGLEPEEISPATLLIVGSVFPEFDSRSLEVGWKTLKKVINGGVQTSLFRQQLTIQRVHQTLSEIAVQSGQGSRRLKEQLLEGILADAVKDESEILVRIIFGEMRIGVSEGIMLDGIAEAADTSLDVVRRALMMTGNLGEIARIALTEGEEGLRSLKASLFVPLKPMLAHMAEDAAEAIEEHGGLTAFEYKYDGARIQIHRKDGEVKVFSRRLSEVTDSIPDIVELIQEKVGGGDVILEGEVIAVGADDKPLPFQDLMRRFTRVKNVEEKAEQIPLRLFLFDLLYSGGELLIDEPYEERWRRLEEVVPPNLLVKRIITIDPEEAESFLSEAIEEGQEGLMVKRLDSPYTPGSRGKLWFKIKRAETLDVVVVAADWGSGRRRGWLSNYHLGVWDGGEYLVIGKTFKGLTDEEFKWMTEKLQELKESETSYTVHVRPTLVVEVAFNEIQASPHYESGYALRFARVTRIREDKSPRDADTLRRVEELYEYQFRYKAKLDL